MPDVQLPEYRVEVAFTDGATTGTALTLDDPSRGILGVGTLGGGLTDDPVWTDITEWLRSCSTNRGSSRVDAPIVSYEPGTLTITLDNSDRRFDPGWLDGPYTEETTDLTGEQTALNSNTGFETGTTGWSAPNGGTFTQASDQVHTGSWSGKLVPSGVGAFGNLLSELVPVTPGQTYVASAWVRNAVTRYVAVGMHWFNSSGVYTGVSEFTTELLTAGTWTHVLRQAVAPVGAASAAMDITMTGTPPSSHILWADEAVFAHLHYRRETQLTAMRAVRVMATWDGTTYEVWRGFADQWDVAWTPGSDYSECVLTATDASKALSGVDRTAVEPSVGGGEDAGARVTRILDSAGWPAGDRIIATGDSTLIATDLSGDPWTELQTVGDSELGEVYVDGGGRIVFRNRLAYLTDARSNTSQGTFGDDTGELPIEDLATASDDATFFNDIRVTRAGGEGVEQVAENTASIDRLFRKTYRPTEPLLETDTAAYEYAHWLLHIARYPELRFTELTTLPAAGPAELWPQVLGREIGDRITVVRRPPPNREVTRRDCFIRGIKHEFTDETWKTTWVLQDATRYGSFLVLDHPVLGALDSNALAY